MRPGACNLREVSCLFTSGGIVWHMPPRKGPESPAELERERRKRAQLKRDMEAMRETARQMRQELQTQFTRIAQLQAVRDEERHADVPRDNLPLMRVR